jgi:hypothetical protein
MMDDCDVGCGRKCGRCWQLWALALLTLPITGWWVIQEWACGVWGRITSKEGWR